jgi:hypothetical protein
MEAASKVGTYFGQQGSRGNGKQCRPIFGLRFHGIPLFLSMTVGSNGYVVAMNKRDVSNNSLPAWPPAEASAMEEAAVGVGAAVEEESISEGKIPTVETPVECNGRRGLDREGTKDHFLSTIPVPEWANVFSFKMAKYARDSRIF